MMRILIAACIMLICGTSSAEWMIYSRDPNSGVSYYDTASLKRIEDDVLTVWIKRFNDAERELINRDGFNITPPGFENFSHELQKIFVNCSNGQTALASHFDYSKNGSVLQSVTLNKSEIRFSDNSPGSLITILVREVCKR